VRLLAQNQRNFDGATTAEAKEHGATGEESDAQETCEPARLDHMTAGLHPLKVVAGFTARLTYAEVRRLR
jgi:hypothetical protein